MLNWIGLYLKTQWIVFVDWVHTMMEISWNSSHWHLTSKSFAWSSFTAGIQWNFRGAIWAESSADRILMNLWFRFGLWIWNLFNINNASRGSIIFAIIRYCNVLGWGVLVIILIFIFIIFCRSSLGLIRQFESLCSRFLATSYFIIFYF